MKTITLLEFAELAKNDEALKEKIKSIIMTGEEMPQELIDLASEYGYEFTKEGVYDEVVEEELSDEELMKVAGGGWSALFPIEWFCKKFFSLFDDDVSDCDGIADRKKEMGGY